jgi:sigma-B regulation protein RsbU (phosphoserine phosphatase)
MELVPVPEVHGQLVERRGHLQSALRRGEDPNLQRLLREVDAALERVALGTYGICETCHDPIEAERLIADPLTRFCLDHLSHAEQRALEQDLELAARVQRGLLPQHDMRVSGWHIDYYYEPAATVSGDYCDVLTTDNASENVFLMFGDVAGKGVAASMLMSQLHAIFRSLVPEGMGVSDVVARANRLFCESSLSWQYATIIALRAQPDGSIELCNAGHCPPILVSGGKATVLDPANIPVGMFCSGSYKAIKLQLNRDDTLVLYTDGVTEAVNGMGEEFGVDRLSDLIAAHRHSAPEALVHTAVQHLNGFRTGTRRADDVTVMAIRRT